MKRQQLKLQLSFHKDCFIFITVFNILIKNRMFIDTRVFGLIISEVYNENISALTKMRAYYRQVRLNNTVEFKCI